MNPDLLEHYERELRHVREMGAEFAREFPKVAGRLSLDGLECADPYVERLLEGFAFCTSRVQLKLEAQFPRFCEALLNTLYPQYMSPTPSMTIVQLEPDMTEASLLDGYVLPRNSILTSLMAPGDQTACEFRTSQDCSLWPIEISEATYLPNSGAVAAAGFSDSRAVRAAIKLRLRCHSSIDFSKLALDKLSLYFRGDGDLPHRLFEQFHANCVGVVAGSGSRTHTSVAQRLPKEVVKYQGFEPEQALLPTPTRAFDGYRLLHEYFAFAPRFLFAEIQGLQPAVKRCREQDLEVAILLNRSDKELAGVLSADNFALHCVPAINLFPKRADRLRIDSRRPEHHIVVDRTRPLDFEVYSVESVLGMSDSSPDGQPYFPLYAPREKYRGRGHDCYYSTHRQPRVLSSKSRRLGPRSSYVGSELFISMVDVNEAPFASDLNQLDVRVLCTNRDLPIEMPVGKGDTDFTLPGGAPIESARCLAGPTRPRGAPRSGELNWRLINQLSLNYLSLVVDEGNDSAVALRDLLAVYGGVGDSSTLRQLEGVGRVDAKPVHRRLPGPGPISFGRGIRIKLHCYDEAFEGSSPFLLGTVLERFFARYASINSFTETALSTENRGEIYAWPSTPGQRHVL